MSKILDVYLHNNFVGHLVQDKHGQMLFTYSESWLTNSDAMPLSQSLPLRKEAFKQKQCRGYFAGILPEEGKRDIIARNLGISVGNDFALLKEIGGECAGAVIFLPAGEQLDNHAGKYKQLTEQELANIIQELPIKPLMAGKDGIRLSLAGAQDKIAVYIENNKIFIPIDGALSTHIIKPAHQRFQGLIFNEYICLKLAKLSGLHVANAEVASVKGMNYLLIERFDRKINKDGKKVRLHQEDFCQALGIISEMKYEAEGGPNLKTCFNLVRKISSRPAIDLQRLLDAVIFNFLVGNNDAHGKNFSFLYFSKDDVRLAPLYDIISTAYYPELSNKMAMKIGGEYIAERVRPNHFGKLAIDTGLAKPRVKERIVDLTKIVLNNLAQIEVDNTIVEEIKILVKTRCERTLSLFV
jgi:serine/threonine-protein kinase HipA